MRGRHTIHSQDKEFVVGRSATADMVPPPGPGCCALPGLPHAGQTDLMLVALASMRSVCSACTVTCPSRGTVPALQTVTRGEPRRETDTARLGKTGTVPPGTVKAGTGGGTDVSRQAPP